MPNKSQLRKHYLSIRNTLNKQTRLHQQHNALMTIQTLPPYHHATKIAVYLPFKGEFDPTDIIQHALQNNKKCFAPVIDDQAQGTMFFSELTLSENKIIFLEKQKTSDKLIDFDLMLIPLVAFDSSGNRLGMGGGFYDRYLAQYSERKPYLLGAAFKEQFCETIPLDPWDQSLDMVLTG